ncbi:MAG TPA: hypothetical protein VH120_12775, partial [Gemmataceae bacterium]|nr:hypothetical protein [Gemmataceae bacterium]
MRRTIRAMPAIHQGAVFALAVGAAGLLATPVKGVATWAVADGNWSSAATWTNGVPGANDNAYVGSTFPGAAKTATVTLSQNTSVNSLSLGNGFNTSGTLDLSGFNLSGTYLSMGSAGTGSIIRTGGGTLSVSQDLSMYSGTLALTAGDTVGRNLYAFSGNTTLATGVKVTQAVLFNGSSAATTGPINVTNSVDVSSGSTLTLGGTLTTQDFYLDGNLNANGQTLST